MTSSKNDDTPLSNSEVYLYKIQYKALLQRFMQAGSSFEKAILTLSTASLGFTLAFVKDLHEKSNMCLLSFVWFFLVTSIFLILLTFYLDQRDTEDQITKFSSAIINKSRKNMSTNLICCLMTILPWISCGLFFIAIILFSIFVYSNIS